MEKGGVPPELGGGKTEMPSGQKKPELKKEEPVKEEAEIDAAIKEAAPAPETASPTAIKLRLGDL